MEKKWAGLPPEQKQGKPDNRRAMMAAAKEYGVYN